MHQLSLADLFGAGATQDGEAISISKSALLGLNANSNNSAESLLIALLLTALANFQGVVNDETGIIVTSPSGAAITFDNSEGFEFLKIINWQAFVKLRFNQRYRFNQIIIFAYANQEFSE